jgi:hypothetical protein
MTSLEGLPSGFNLPQNLVSAGNHAFNSTFYNCSKINLLPNFFNFPQNLVSVGTHVFGDIFSGNINEAGAYFEVNVVELTNVTLLVIPAFDPLPPYYYNHSQTPYCTIFNIGQEYAVTRGSTY